MHSAVLGLGAVQNGHESAPLGHYNLEVVRVRSLSLLCLWTISGCAEESLTFRAEQRTTGGERDQPTVDGTGGGPSPAADADAAASTDEPPDAQVEMPFVSEFDLAAPPRTGTGGRRPPTEPPTFLPPDCDAGSCPCDGVDECPAGWQCVEQICIASCDDDRDCPPGWSCEGRTCRLDD